MFWQMFYKLEPTLVKIYKRISKLPVPNLKGNREKGLEILKKEYWVKNSFNRWVCVDESIVLKRKAIVHCYDLRLFVLRKLQGRCRQC